MISLDFYFFHIEKCAGTSFRRAIYAAFRDEYSDEQLHIPGCNRPGDVTISDYAENGSYLAALKVVADHSNPGELAALLDAPVTVKFGVTALRHPVDRALSHFHYFYGEPASLHEFSNERLVRFMTRHGSLQTARLSNDTGSLEDALAALRSMGSIILAEEYTRSIRLLNQVNPFGARFEDSFVENVTGGDDDRGYKTLYSDDFKRSLERFCAPDLALYAEGTKLFREMCERTGL
jgi:hypothetical protein